MITIRIEQLDENGDVWRTLNQYARPDELEAKLERIERAFYAPRTRVTY